MYAYLMVKELSRHHYYNAAVYDIASLYWGETIAGHSVVEVETQDGNYVFDPTYGNYYAADIETLCESENAESFKVGEAAEDVYYQMDRFFEQVQVITVY